MLSDLELAAVIGGVLQTARVTDRSLTQSAADAANRLAMEGYQTSARQQGAGEADANRLHALVYVADRARRESDRAR